MNISYMNNNHKCKPEFDHENSGDVAKVLQFTSQIVGPGETKLNQDKVWHRYYIIHSHEIYLNLGGNNIYFGS